VALSLFQYIGIGLATAIVLVPIVRWFWKWFDKPSKSTIEYLQKQQEDDEEKALWSQIEAKIEAEQSIQNQLTTIALQKVESAGKSLDQEKASTAWESLGVDEPLEPVKREVLELVVEGIEEPDWELVEKIQNLSKPETDVSEAPDLDRLIQEKTTKPETDVPEAPDLDRLIQEKTTKPGWADDW